MTRKLSPAERKQQQRDRQRAWLKKNTAVLTAEALVSRLMELDREQTAKFRLLLESKK